MRLISILSVLFIAFFVVLGLRKEKPAPEAPPVPVRQVAQTTRAVTAPAVAVPEVAPAPEPEPAPKEPHVFVDDPAADEEPKVSTRPMTEEEMRNVVVLKTHQYLTQLERSPAKDTPEAKAIQGILADHRISRAAVPIAYGVAQEYHRIKKMTGSEVMAREVIRPQKNNLKAYGFGDVDEKFWEQILAIQPTIPMGPPVFEQPKPGDLILTE